MGQEKKLWCKALLHGIALQHAGMIDDLEAPALWQHLYGAACCEPRDAALVTQTLSHAGISNRLSQLHHLNSVMSPDIVLHWFRH